MDIEDNTYRTEYILPCAINIPSEDDIVIDFVTNVSMVYLFISLCEMQPMIFNLILFQSAVWLYWVCLYSEEKLDTMERNLKFKTFPTGVKKIDYRYPDDKHVLYVNLEFMSIQNRHMSV